MREEDALYCRQKARAYDIDAYLAALFAPSSIRPALWTLEALAGEIAHGAGQNAEPAIAQIRLQWWYDAIARLYGGHNEPHPVLRSLAPMVKAGLPAAAFERLIEARFAQLEQGDNFETAKAAQTALLALKHAAVFGVSPGLSGAVLEPAAEALAARDHLQKSDDLIARARDAIGRAARAYAAEGPPRGLVLLLPLASLRLALAHLSNANTARVTRLDSAPVYQKQWVMLKAVLRGYL
jgi:phytoene synthase